MLYLLAVLGLTFSHRLAMSSLLMIIIIRLVECELSVPLSPIRTIGKIVVKLKYGIYGQGSMNE